VLGLVSHRIIAGLASSLLAGDLAAALEQLDQVYTYGMDLKRFINDLLAWFRDLVVCRVSGKPEQLLDLAEEEMAALRETAAAHSVETLSFMFNVLMESLEKASFSSRPRFALELAFIRAVQVREVVPVTDILARLDAVAAGVALEPAGSAPAGSAPAGSAPAGGRHGPAGRPAAWPGRQPACAVGNGLSCPGGIRRPSRAGRPCPGWGRCETNSSLCTRAGRRGHGEAARGQGGGRRGAQG